MESWKPGAIAVAAGLAAFVAGTGAETAIIRAVRGDRSALEWISDALLSAAVAALSYLWLTLKDSRTRLFDVERKAIALDEQLRLAATIQRNLLPDIPLATDGFRWAARMVPAGQVGGDFYDFLETSADITLVVVGDVSGKGIPAALIQSSLKALFRLIALDTDDPAAIAERMGSVLHGQTGGAPYATAIVLRFEHAPRRIAYVNAGHPAGLILRGTAVLPLEAGGSPLGLLPGARYGSAVLDLQPGDMGVLVTDGITEALEGVPANVWETLRDGGDRLVEAGSPVEVCAYLLERAAKGPGPLGVEHWQDDATVLVFRADGRP